jgi:hypothetical protein
MAPAHLLVHFINFFLWIIINYTLFSLISEKNFSFYIKCLPKGKEMFCSPWNMKWKQKQQVRGKTTISTLRHWFMIQGKLEIMQSDNKKVWIQIIFNISDATRKYKFCLFVFGSLRTNWGCQRPIIYSRRYWMHLWKKIGRIVTRFAKVCIDF